MRRFVVYSLLITAVTVAVYWPVGDHDFVNYDEPLYVTRNPQVQAGLTLEGLRFAFTSTSTGNWHPLTWISHMLDVELFGLRPRGHHWVSVAIHIVATLLLFEFLSSTTSAKSLSAIAASIFALHPLHVESVAWIAERKDVLCGVFFFLSLNLYAAFALRKLQPRSPASPRHPERQRRISEESGASDERSFAGAQDDGTDRAQDDAIRSVSSGRGARRLFYVAALFAFICALLSKPMAVTLPFVLMLIDVWPLQRLRTRSKSISQLIRDAVPMFLEKLPFFAVSIAFAIITLLLQGRVESIRGLDQASLGLRIANALVSYVAYLGKFAIPVNLAVYYPYPSSGLPWWKVAGAALALLLITVTVLLVARKQPWLPVGWFWFFGMLVPVIGLVQVGSQAMADRYMYLPMAGLIVAAVWWFAGVWKPRDYARLLGFAVAIAICVVQGYLANRQLMQWRDSVALFEHALAVAPESATARANLGAAYLETGNAEKAHENLVRAIQLKPNDAKIHNNLGIYFLRHGKNKQAISSFLTAVALDTNNPALHCNLGRAYKADGQFDAARLHLATAIQLYRSDAQAHSELGDVLLTVGEGASAALHYEEVLRLQPDNRVAALNLGIALGSVGRFEEAIPYLEAGLELVDNSSAVYYLARVRAELGQTRQAIQLLERYKHIKPGLGADAQSLLSELKERVDGSDTGGLE
jgi:Flp pilus assembly protein TadD